jgi:hypothetical protein
MKTAPNLQFRNFEGRRVSVSLADGSRLDDCQLVSAGQPRLRTLWVHSNGVDVFIPRADILDIWEPPMSVPVRAD